jgi:hypothetical protein
VGGLTTISDTVTTERFQLDIYFICTISKPPAATL